MKFFANYLKHHRLTTFKSSQTLGEARKVLLTTLEALKSTIIEKGTIFKASVPVAKGTIQLRVTIKSINEFLTLIEIARMSGTNLDFLRVYRPLKQRLI